MAQRVRLTQSRVRLEKEEPEKSSTRVRLNSPEKSSPSSRVRLDSSAKRVRLDKPQIKSRFSFSSKYPHLHTRIVHEPPRQGVTIVWCKMPQDDGSVLYDRIEKNETAANRSARAVINSVLSSQLDKFPVRGNTAAWQLIRVEDYPAVFARADEERRQKEMMGA